MEAMRLDRLARLKPPPLDPSQSLLFSDLPPRVRIQAAIRLTEANVARTVPPGCAGVFFLKKVFRGGRVDERVGRDDVDLRQRLLQMAREGEENVLFGWILAEHPHDAYRIECYLWHAQGGSWRRISGDGHPEPVEPIPFLGCPDCEE
jgi:hypothetical protein